MHGTRMFHRNPDKARGRPSAGCTTAALAILFTLAAPLPAGDTEPDTGKIGNYYTIEDIETPEGVVPEIGGMDFMPDGRLAVAFHRDGVWTYDPETGDWQQFAQGLHEPLGLHAESDNAIVVMQRPELTRLRDTDGDGRADHYQTITDAFGMTGNYHEFAFGPAVGPDGNYYVGLNTASNGAGVRHEVRGERNPIGRAGRMYAYVPYRGWVLRVTPEGETTPWALGFRSPNGLGFDLNGNLFVTDNQGDWKGTSPLYHVERGGFYGHVASLVWKDGFEGDPLERPVPELAKMRTRAAALFPHGTMANSPTQPIADSTGGAFGPFAGQMLVGEMNQPRIMRMMLEEVGGVLQGAAVPFYDNAGLGLGVHRMTFGPEGALWVGHTLREHGWAGATGLQRITWTGDTLMDVLRMNLTGDGFNLTFTRPVDPATASDPDAYRFTRYYYEYHRSYGSDKFDETPVEVEAAEVSEDGRRVALDLAELKPGYVYELHLKGVKSADGGAVVNPFLAYHLRRLANGTAPPPMMAMAAEPVALENGRATIQAEAAQLLVGAARSSQHPGHSGDGYIDFANPAGDYAEWRAITDEPGDHSLVFRYAMEGAPRPMRLSINGRVVSDAVHFTDTGGWTEWATVRVPAALQKGENTIRLETTGDSGPNLDRFTVSRQP